MSLLLTGGWQQMEEAGCAGGKSAYVGVRDGITIRCHSATRYQFAGNCWQTYLNEKYIAPLFYLPSAPGLHNAAKVGQRLRTYRQIYMKE